MFDKFKAMGALAGLMQNRDALREAGERIRERLSDTVVTGESGGVRVEMACDMRIRRVDLPPDDADEGPDRAGLELLIAHAANDAIAHAREAVEGIVADEMGRLGLPPELGGQLTELIR